MKRYLSFFTQSLFALATVVGLYLGAAALKLEWIFWVVIALSFVFAASRLVLPHVLAVFRAWRSHPSLVSRIKQLETEARDTGLKLEESKKQFDMLSGEVETASAEGVARGRLEAVGEFLATSVAIPEIVQLEDYDGQISLVVETSKGVPPLTSRYQLLVGRTGQLRGIVEVAEIDLGRGIAYLICVEPSMPAFWSALSERVLTDSTPPRDIVLETIALPDLSIEPTHASLSAEALDKEEAK